MGLPSKCAWCGEHIPEGHEVFAVGAKAHPHIDLKDLEGKTTEIYCLTARKKIPVLVVTPQSQAKREGYDMIMMVCSEDCGASLRAAMVADGIKPRKLP